MTSLPSSSRSYYRLWVPSLAFFLLALGLALGCQSGARIDRRPPSKVDALSLAALVAPAAATSQPNLTQEEAEGRVRQISNVAYGLKLELAPQGETFTGEVQIDFDFRRLPQARPLALDFKQGGEVRKLVINGAVVERPEYLQQGRIVLPLEQLRDGRNTVEVRFAQKYMNDGTGLYKFDDPEDRQRYVITQFQPYYANYMFPCFDQPDLKAKLKLQVAAPARWQVVTATRETLIEKRGTMRVWNFAETPPLSPYLYSVHAGPFHSWTSSAQSGDKIIPLRLFSRQSIKKYVDPELFFLPTRQGFPYMTDYFGTAYPFQKYDQVIAPNFPSGAMENVASVTFSEDYVSRGRSTDADKEAIANVVLHELAHHWFGNLVTMRWWNGLWLNESFATFMATQALVEVTSFKGAWESFQEESKVAAYYDDQLSTTHPVDGPIRDTQAAYTAFSNITYGKGASVLKQLVFLIGEDRFKVGLHDYFQRHAYQNTEASDFLLALTRSSGRDLKPWAASWIENAGVDTVRADWECGTDGKIRKLELLAQVPTKLPAPAKPRLHRTALGILDVTSLGTLKVRSIVKAEYSEGRTSVRELIGEKCPALVFVNAGDHDYALIRLDKKSLRAVGDSLSKIEDSSIRNQLWPMLFDGVLSGEVTPESYLDIVDRHLPLETNSRISSLVMKTLSGVGASGYHSALYFLPNREAQARWSLRLEALAWKMAEAAPAGSDAQKTAFDSYLQLVRTPSGAENLAQVFSARKTLRGFNLDQDRRWDVLVRLSSLGHSKASTWLAQERRRDRSERGIKMALAAQVAFPQAEIKNKWFEHLSRGAEDLSYSRQMAIMNNLLPAWQEDLRSSLADRFYQRLPSMLEQFDQEFIEKFIDTFVPSLCNPASVARLEGFLKDQAGKLPPAAARELKAELEESTRCVRLRARGS